MSDSSSTTALYCKPALDTITSLVAAGIVTILAPLLCLIVIITLLTVYRIKVSRWRRRIAAATNWADNLEGEVDSGTSSSVDGKTGKQGKQMVKFKKGFREIPESELTEGLDEVHEDHSIPKGHDHGLTEDLGDDSGMTRDQGRVDVSKHGILHGIPKHHHHELSTGDQGGADVRIYGGQESHHHELSEDQGDDSGMTGEQGGADVPKHGIHGVPKGHVLSKDHGGNQRNEYSKEYFHKGHDYEGQGDDIEKPDVTDGWVDVDVGSEAKCQHTMCLHDHTHDGISTESGKSHNLRVYMSDIQVRNKTPLPTKGFHSAVELSVDKRDRAQGSLLPKSLAWGSASGLTTVISSSSITSQSRFPGGIVHVKSSRS